MFLKVMAKGFDNFEPLAYSLLEEDFSKELASLFNEDADDIEDTPVPESVHDDPTSSVISFLISELECPVCYQPMLGHLRLPLLCPNGHPCCSSCASRMRRICPTCRSSNTRWSSCLFLERMGSYMVEKGMMITPPEQDVWPVGISERQAMRRRRSARLERAREHMDMWGRGPAREEVVGAEGVEDGLNDDQDIGGLAVIEHGIDREDIGD